MTMFKVLILSSLFGAVTCSQVLHRRWDNGVTATGTTDPDVVSPCYYYANNISSTDICGSLEAYFGITFTQLHAWVSGRNASEEYQTLTSTESFLTRILLRFDRRLELLR